MSPRAATRAAIAGALLAGATLLGAGAARAQAAPQACIPGQQFACGCAGGAASTQKCNAAGTALEPCQCGSAAAPAPAPAPAPGSEGAPCPSNQIAPDGTCLVSADAAVAPLPPPPPPPAPAAIVATPQPAPAPPKDQGPAARGPNTSLLAGGLALFAVGYGATIGINYGVCADSTSWRGCDSKGLSFIPIAGSFILGAAENTELSYRLIAFTLGLAQAGGVALVGLSFAGSGGKQTAIHVVPNVSRDGGGATLVGRF